MDPNHTFPCDAPTRTGMCRNLGTIRIAARRYCRTHLEKSIQQWLSFLQSTHADTHQMGWEIHWRSAQLIVHSGIEKKGQLELFIDDHTSLKTSKKILDAYFEWPALHRVSVRLEHIALVPKERQYLRWFDTKRDQIEHWRKSLVHAGQIIQTEQPWFMSNNAHRKETKWQKEEVWTQHNDKPYLLFDMGKETVMYRAVGSNTFQLYFSNEERSIKEGTWEEDLLPLLTEDEHRRISWPYFDTLEFRLS